MRVVDTETPTQARTELSQMEFIGTGPGSSVVDLERNRRQRQSHGKVWVQAAQPAEIVQINNVVDYMRGLHRGTEI